VCRNIKTLYNFEPRATEEETSAASLQYARTHKGASTAKSRHAWRSAVGVVRPFGSRLGAEGDRGSDIFACHSPPLRAGKRGFRPREVEKEKTYQYRP
jgi:hypothetical protein